MSCVRALLVACCVIGVGQTAAAQGIPRPRALESDFYLKPGDGVVFYGDSITDQRLYTTFTESYVITRFPDLSVRFVHSGWGGDRVSGGGGGGIYRRLRRDVFEYRPTVVTIMLGMNDASYRAFDEKIFQTYADGYKRIVDDLKEGLPGVRLTLIQPSPFDDVTRAPAFEGGYNAVLVRYGEFVKQLAKDKGVDVADLNTYVVDATKKAKEIDAELAKKLNPDRVHPSPGGQLLMAAALLKAWKAPAVVTSVRIEAGKDASDTKFSEENTFVAGWTVQNGLSWKQHDNALPMPIDLKDPVIALAVKASDILDSLSKQWLEVKGLKDGDYVLKIDGGEIGTFPATRLAQGVNLSEYQTPMLEQALRVHRLTLRHNDIHFLRWREVQVPNADLPAQHIDAAMKALDVLEADVVAERRKAAAPQPHSYELTAK